MTTMQYDIWRERPDGYSELVATIEAETGPEALRVARERGIGGALWIDEDDDDDVPQPV